ncbi:hypothetical protein F4859DRAFT_526189 [Xylaria cf. heliscus]|nr:hypothetical protein F4859DRAFT_526189 [Xylaria cf. heliscus]
MFDGRSCKRSPGLKQELKLDVADVKQDIAGINARFDTCEEFYPKRIAFSESNFIVRTQNSTKFMPHDKLLRLYDVSNVKIADFPGTPAGIDSLGAPQLNSIIRQLGHVPPSNLYHKRRELKKLAGIIAESLTISNGE